MDNEKKLTPKQRLFIEAYCVHKNATRAAQEAGYSKKTAYSIGQALLKKVEIMSIIEAKLEKTVQKHELTKDWVVSRLMAIGNAHIGKFGKVTDSGDFKALPLDEIDEQDLRGIQSISTKRMSTEQGDSFETKIQVRDTVRALEVLGKHLNLFKEGDLNGSNDGSGKGADTKLIKERLTRYLNKVK